MLFRSEDIGGIDGVSSLENQTLMFYNTGIVDEIGYISNFYDTTNYDISGDLVASSTIAITQTQSLSNSLVCDSTSALVVGDAITFTGTTFGNIQEYSTTLPLTIYYIKEILSSTEFSVSLTPNGEVFSLFDAFGSMLGNINQGLFEEGYYVDVSQYFFKKIGRAHV